MPLHQVAANEGSAVGLAIGFWLQTRNPAHVYLQNSGLLNAGNPLISLAHGSVYDIPMTLTVGWRGQPNAVEINLDEPQHRQSGQKTEDFLSNFGFNIIHVKSESEYLDAIRHVHQVDNLRDAILVPRGVFDGQDVEKSSPDPNEIFTRRRAIESIYRALASSHAFVSGTGYMSRDLASIRSKNEEDTIPVFYLVGGMGHVASVSAGISIGGRRGRIAAIEGDGGAMMHLGSISALATEKVGLVDFFILQNGVHASVGGQPVLQPEFDYQRFARACGFDSIGTVNNELELQNRLLDLVTRNEQRKSSLTVVRIEEPELLEASSRPEGFYALARKFNPNSM
jgi:phosphonopyruvate decarboxylase